MLQSIFIWITVTITIIGGVRAVSCINSCINCSSRVIPHNNDSWKQAKKNMNVLPDGSITMEDYNRQTRNYQNKEYQRDYRSVFPVTVHHHAIRKLGHLDNPPARLNNPAPSRPPPYLQYSPPRSAQIYQRQPQHIAYNPPRRRIEEFIQRQPGTPAAINYSPGNYSNPEEIPQFPILMTETQINEEFDKTLGTRGGALEKKHRFPKMFPSRHFSDCEFGVCMEGCCEAPNMPIHATTLPGSPGPTRPLYLVLHPPASVPSCPAPCQPLCLPQCNMRLQYSISQPAIQFPSQMQCRPECMPSCLVECVVSVPSIIRCSRLPCRCSFGFEQCSPFTCCSTMQMPFMRSNPKEKITIEDQTEPITLPFASASRSYKKSQKFRTASSREENDRKQKTTKAPEVTTTLAPTTTTTAISSTTADSTDYEPYSMEEDKTYEMLVASKEKSSEKTEKSKEEKKVNQSKEGMPKPHYIHLSPIYPEKENNSIPFIPTYEVWKMKTSKIDKPRIQSSSFLQSLQDLVSVKTNRILNLFSKNQEKK